MIVSRSGRPAPWARISVLSPVTLSIGTPLTLVMMSPGFSTPAAGIPRWVETTWTWVVYLIPTWVSAAAVAFVSELVICTTS